MILEVAAYDRSLAYMFDWERSIVGDLAAIWPNLTQPTTTPKNFSSKIVNNIDVRITQDNTQQTILAYGFFSNKYLIITTKDSAIPDIIAKLAL